MLMIRTLLGLFLCVAGCGGVTAPSACAPSPNGMILVYCKNSLPTMKCAYCVDRVTDARTSGCVIEDAYCISHCDECG